MLRIDQIAAVRRLLAARHSQRAVHRLTGVSRGAIARIAAGSRGRLGDRIADATVDATSGPAGLPVRCPTCGHRVEPPCRICRARAWREATVVRPFPHDAAERSSLRLGLELSGEHLARYEALRKERLRGEGRTEKEPNHERRAS